MKTKKMAAGIAVVTALAVAGGTVTAYADSAQKDADGKYDPVLTITIGKQSDENSGKYADGEDINNNPMTQLGVEKLGIQIETTLLGGDADNYDTKLRLALTSADELPDVFPVYSAQMASDMIESGSVKAIDDDIEQYMPDRLKEIYEQYPESFYAVQKDGKTYGIAINPCLVVSSNL